MNDQLNVVFVHLLRACITDINRDIALAAVLSWTDEFDLYERVTSMKYIIHGFYKVLRFETHYCVDVYSSEWSFYFIVMDDDTHTELSRLNISDEKDRSIHTFITDDEVSMFVTSNTADEDVEKIRETLIKAGIDVKQTR